jgi:hypothetical protein
VLRELYRDAVLAADADAVVFGVDAVPDVGTSYCRRWVVTHLIELYVGAASSRLEPVGSRNEKSCSHGGVAEPAA